MRGFLFLILLLSIKGLWATKITTEGNYDWNDPLSWPGGIVPDNPDTIVLRHYITFSHDLIIKAPTVLIINSEGTLCGDFHLDIACGAVLVNRGYMYVNRLTVRDGENHNRCYAKQLITVTGCPVPGFGKGFKSVPPQGEIKVWPPVVCKSEETNWPRNITAVWSQDERQLLFYPNPVSDGGLFIQYDLPFTAVIADVLGNRLSEWRGENNLSIDTRTLSQGIYFLQISSGGRVMTRKLLRE
jgi:hypothetical protein